MVILFWFCLAVICYVYVGYPCAIWLLARFRPARITPPAAEWPTLSLIISAYNEERCIREKLDNSLLLGYPRGKMEILVASDGSTDQTDAIVGEFQSRGIRLIRLEGRQGKTAAQNAAAAQATGDILVFSDANALYDWDALQWLIRPFDHEDVGSVEGRRADFASGDSGTAKYELSFREMESHIKSWESRVLSCTGATGPIYAVRRALYIPLDPAMISDLMEPILIMARQRKRHVFEPCSISRESVLPNLQDEYYRKIRIITRCLNSLRMAPEVLNPLQNGWFALQVISHRLLRWLVPVFALTAFSANIFLLSQPLYRITFLFQTAFILLAAIGAALDKLSIGPSILRLPHYFCTINLAALSAIGNFLRGQNIVMWRTQRV